MNRLAAAFGLIASITAMGASAQQVSVEELEGEPFARIKVVNICGDHDATHTVETSRGPVTLHYHENENGCAKEADDIEVFELPNGVIAAPLVLSLIEKSYNVEEEVPYQFEGPSDPGYIYLYTWLGV